MLLGSKYYVFFFYIKIFKNKWHSHFLWLFWLMSYFRHFGVMIDKQSKTLDYK